MPLDISSLKKAVDSLDRALKVGAVGIRGQVNTDQEEVIRAGVIQNFEFTYELCWKFMKRWLELNVGSANVDGSTRKELFRLAAESRLINGVENWFKYHSARNETAHTYDPDKASEIYRLAAPFAADARKFLEVLEQRND
ncbi:MAG: nucleotidyltransferase substrate binding protein [Elusimicrobia bacterium]|nr:nucleotidyltransferase substrate binding protein [Elusimicrobiota bacterium]